jgi:preprotein translocase subunit SecD
MQKSVAWRFYISIFVILLSVYLLIPTVWNLNHPNDKGKLPSWLPKAAMRLGLDLQGGIHLVMGVDLDEVIEKQMLAYGHSAEKELTTAGVTGLQMKADRQKGELEITATSKADREKVSATLQKYEAFEFVGETDTALVLRLNSQASSDIRGRALDQSIETIRNRIDEFGVAEPIISKKGDSQILVQFPGADDPERLKKLVGETAKLNFHIVPSSNNGKLYQEQQMNLQRWIADAEKAGSYTRETFPKLSEYRDRLNTDLKDKLPPNTFIAFEKAQDPTVVGKFNLRPYLLSSIDFVSGEYINNAQVSMDQSDRLMGSQNPIVSFSLNPAGTPLFGDMTRKYIKHQMAIVLDGIVKSAPTIQSAITGGSGQITLGSGSFEKTMQEAKDLAIVLRAGALPATIELQEERVIGPSLGHEAIAAGKSALILSAILIFLFVWIYYGWIGLIGNLSTVANIAMIFAILGMMGATLTLPGIAGIVLTIGMAVDALILIYERMREELRAGRHIQAVIEAGFEKAFSSILDSNVTTAIGAFVLLEFGTGSIRGFALTLLIGIVVNVFTATFLTRSLIKYFYSSRSSKIGLGLPKHELESIHA